MEKANDLDRIYRIHCSANASITTPGNSGGICAVCQKVDFVVLTDLACKYHKFDYTEFRIGTLQHIREKQFCPGCRLIFSICESVHPGFDKMYETPITLRRKHTLLFLRDLAVGLTIKGMHSVGDGAFEDRSLIEVAFQLQSKHGETQQVVGAIVRGVNGAEEPVKTQPEISLKGQNFIFALRGRDIQPYVDSQLIRHWTQNCETHHSQCRPSTPSTIEKYNTWQCSQQLPNAIRKYSIRLMDVQEYKIVDTSLTEKYVALSYVWGPNTKGVLVRDTISQYQSMQGLKDVSIPRTISDAIQLVKDIGLRYIWVDSLCILQDDLHDKVGQLSLMTDIYRQATFVIVAAAGNDANAGLPGTKNSPRSVYQQTETIEGIAFKTLRPPLLQELERSVWGSRGWTFPEARLCQRALIFTDHLISWNCQMESIREDLMTDSRPFSLGRIAISSLWSHTSLEITTTDGQGHTESRPDLPRAVCPCHHYYDLVEEICGREFYDPRDIFWAFLGVLEAEKLHFPDGFIWCHPYQILDASLLWSEAPKCQNMHLRPAVHTVFKTKVPLNLQYPSWSWLSTTAFITFKNMCSHAIVSEVVWHKPSKGEIMTSAIRPKFIKQEHSAEEDEDWLSKMLPTDPNSVTSNMDYGPLHFTARVARLIIKKDEERQFTVESNHGEKNYESDDIDQYTNGKKRNEGDDINESIIGKKRDEIDDINQSMTGRKRDEIDDIDQSMTGKKRDEIDDIDQSMTGEKEDEINDIDLSMTEAIVVLHEALLQRFSDEWALRSSTGAISGEGIILKQIALLLAFEDLPNINPVVMQRNEDLFKRGRTPCFWVGATIFSQTGQTIGRFSVQSQFFGEKSERVGEFVLLSSNACECELEDYDVEHPEHFQGCEHIYSHNVMLIDWIDGIAYRRGLAEIEKEGWEKVETELKGIKLG